MDHLVPVGAFLKAASEIGLPLLWWNLAQVLPLQELNAEQVGPVNGEIFAGQEPVGQCGTLAGGGIGQELPGFSGGGYDSRKVEVDPAEEFCIVAYRRKGAA